MASMKEALSELQADVNDDETAQGHAIAQLVRRMAKRRSIEDQARLAFELTHLFTSLGLTIHPDPEAPRTDAEQAEHMANVQFAATIDLSTDENGEADASRAVELVLKTLLTTIKSEKAKPVKEETITPSVGDMLLTQAADGSLAEATVIGRGSINEMSDADLLEGFGGSSICPEPAGCEVCAETLKFAKPGMYPVGFDRDTGMLHGVRSSQNRERQSYGPSIGSCGNPGCTLCT